MGLAKLRAGATVRVEGQESRVIGSPDGKNWQFENIKTRFIWNMSTSELLLSLERGTLAFACGGDHKPGISVKEALSNTELELAKLRLAYVRPLLDGPLSQGRCLEAVQQVWQVIRQPATPPSLSSVRRWIGLYRGAGRDIRALVDQTHKKGNRTLRYPTEVVEEVDKAIASKCLQRTAGTLESALGEARLNVRRLNDERLMTMQLPLPTRRLVTRRFQVIPAFDRYAARHGQEAARKHFRWVRGHRVAERPLERAEMDHTLLDIFVVDSSGHPLGRPNLTLVIDAFSRCVLGFYVGFTPPSYLSVAKCLKQAIRPKADYLRTHPDVKNEWPCFGVMTELSVDNGLEFHSDALEQACGSLGIELHYSPRKEPWGKGKIERFLGTLNRDLCHSIPGSTFANILDRGDYDASKNATVTLNTLQTIILKWIVDVYHQSPHRALGTSPAAMWNSSITLEDIHLADESVNFEVIMGRPHERRLTHKGIEYENLLYNSHELQELRKVRGTTLDVEIRVDEDDLSHIYVIFDKRLAPYRVPALNTLYAQGLSLWQHKVHKNHIAQNPGNSDVHERSLLEAKRDLADLVSAALASKKSRSGRRLGRYSDHNGDRLPLGSHGKSEVTPEPYLPGSLAAAIDPTDPKCSTSGTASPIRIVVPHFQPERKRDS